MIKPIIVFPDGILRTKALTVYGITYPPVNQLLTKLAGDLLDTMRANNGIGLSANQIGNLPAIMVVSTLAGPKVFINPVIIEYSGTKVEAEEGCLSLPGISRIVSRSSSVWVKKLDFLGQTIIEKYEDLTARIIQHEVDHLNGKLIIDDDTDF